MNSDTIVDFYSRKCKSNDHNSCGGKWNGFGFNIYCACLCHKSVSSTNVLQRTNTNQDPDSNADYSEVRHKYCSECFERTEYCLCSIIEGYDAYTGYPIISITEEEWDYLNGNYDRRKHNKVS